ncbi:MAG: hypothetical protein ACE361_22725 [Aureliella sp.]
MNSRALLHFLLLAASIGLNGTVTGQSKSDRVADGQEVLDGLVNDGTRLLRSFSVDGLLIVAKHYPDGHSDLKEYVFRKSTAVRDGKQFARLDLRVEDLINAESNFLYEHDLACKEFLFHGFDLKQGRGVKRYEADEFPALDSLINLRPEYVCFYSSKSGFGFPLRKSRDAIANLRVFEAKPSLGRFAMRVVHSSGMGGAEYLFEKQNDSWLLLRSNSRSIDKKPIDPLSYDGVGFEGWRSYASSSCVWKKVDDRWLPEMVSGASRQQRFDDESQLVLANWKFGEDVLIEMLNPDRFSEETIQRQVDFEEIRDALRGRLDAISSGARR